MSMQPSTSIWEQLQRIDRRILYLVLMIVVAIPTLRPVTVPNAPSQMSRDLWEMVNNCPPEKIMIISSTWTKSTRGESQAQAAALINHLMAKKIRFLTSSFDAQASQVIQNLVNAIAAENPQYGYQYGTNWAHMGYQPSASNFIKSINVDLLKPDRLEAVKQQPLKDQPMMQGIKGIDDVYMVIEISASGSHLSWIQFLKPGINFGFCPTSVMAPESIPYYQTGQIKGVLWGAKGGYDYEQLNVEHNIGKYDKGRQYMAPLSAAVGLVMIAILVGNIAQFLSRAQGGRS